MKTENIKVSGAVCHRATVFMLVLSIAAAALYGRGATVADTLITPQYKTAAFSQINAGTSPNRVFTTSMYIYSLDPYAKKLTVWRKNSVGTALRTFNGIADVANGSGSKGFLLASPYGMGKHPSQNIIAIADKGTAAHRISFYSFTETATAVTFTYLGSFSDGIMLNPTDVAFHPAGGVVVSGNLQDTSGAYYVRLTGAYASMSADWAGANNFAGMPNLTLEGVTVDQATGNMYFASNSKHCVIEANGSTLLNIYGHYGVPGDGPGYLNSPADAAIWSGTFPTPKLAVADRFNNRIVLFDIGSTTAPYATICYLGTEPGQVSKPYSLYVAPGTSELTVADSMNRRVQVFNVAGLTDNDGDGMPDSWETANGLNPAVNDAALDPDGDGLTNFEEFHLGTKPQNADTDGDGLNDGQEVNLFGTDPLDPNSPGAGSFVFSGPTEIPESATGTVTIVVGISGKSPTSNLSFTLGGSIAGRAEAVESTISFPAGVSTAQFTFRPLNGNTTCTLSLDPVPLGSFPSGSHTVKVLNKNPIISSATASATVTNVNDVIEFTGVATDPASDTLTYTWYFGNSTPPKTGTSASTSYSQAGVYVVKLVVTDPDGGSSTESLTIVILDPAAPMDPAEFTMTAITPQKATFRYPTSFTSSDIVVMVSPVMTSNMLLWDEWLPLSQANLQAGGGFTVSSTSMPIFPVMVTASPNADGYTYVTFDIGPFYDTEQAMFFRAAVKAP